MRAISFLQRREKSEEKAGREAIHPVNLGAAEWINTSDQPINSNASASKHQYFLLGVNYQSLVAS